MLMNTVNCTLYYQPFVRPMELLQRKEHSYSTKTGSILAPCCRNSLERPLVSGAEGNGAQVIPSTAFPL